MSYVRKGHFLTLWKHSFDEQRHQEFRLWKRNIEKLNLWKRERSLARPVGERASLSRETSETSLEKLSKTVSLEKLARPVGERALEGQTEEETATHVLTHTPSKTCA